MPKQWQPAEGRVIVKRDEVSSQIHLDDEREESSVLVAPYGGPASSVAGGKPLLYMPDITKETRQRYNEFAVVMAVGPPLVLEDGSKKYCSAEPGDRVLIQPSSGRQVTLNGVTLDILPFAAILAVEREIKEEGAA